MSAITFVTATARAADGSARPVRLAGGGAYSPYLLDGQPHLAGLFDRPRFRAELGFGPDGWTGGTVPTTGTVSWMPALAGSLAELAALYWPDAPIAVDGGPEEGPLTRLLTGTVAGAAVDDGMLVLTIADLSASIDKPLLGPAFAGTGGLEGPTEAAGRPKRRSWGSVFNVEARPIVPAYEIHEVGDPARPLGAIPAVRDKGREGPVEVLPWAGSAAATLDALKGRVPPRGGAVVAPSIACVRWWTTPAGPLTCDLVGEAGAAAVPIAEAILATVGGPAIAEVAAARALRPAAAGLHVARAEETAAEALDRLLLGVSLLWVLDPVGAIRVREWTWDTGGAGPLQARFLAREATLPPTGRRRVGYRANNRVHTAAEISAALFLEDAAASPNYQLPTPAELAKLGGIEAGATVGATPAQADTIAASAQRIAQVASDGVITAGAETDQIAREWRAIDAEWRSSNALALEQAAAGAETAAGLQARAYAAAKLNSASGDGSGLNDYLDSLTNPRGQWRDPATDKPVVGATLRQRFADAIEGVKALTRFVGAASGRTAVVDPVFGRMLQPDGTTVAVANAAVKLDGAVLVGGGGGYLTQGPNLAVNPNFDNNADGYAVAGAPSGLPTVTTATSGSVRRHIRLTPTATSLQHPSFAPTGPYRMPLRPGETAVCRFSWRGNGDLNSNSARMNLQIQYRDALGNLISNGGGAAQQIKVLDSWTTFLVSEVAPAGTASAGIRISVVGAGFTYIDIAEGIYFSTVDPGATKGAQAGRDLLLSDGTSATDALIRTDLGTAAALKNSGTGAYANNLAQLDAPASATLTAAKTSVDRVASDGWITAGQEKRVLASLWKQIDDGWQFWNSRAIVIANAGLESPAMLSARSAAALALNAPAGDLSGLNNYLVSLSPLWTDATVDTPVSGAALATRVQNAIVTTNALARFVIEVSGQTAAVDPYFGKLRLPTGELIEVSNQVIRNGGLAGIDGTAAQSLSYTANLVSKVATDGIITAGQGKRDLVAAWSLRVTRWSNINARALEQAAAGTETPAGAAARVAANNAFNSNTNGDLFGLNDFLNSLQPAWDGNSDTPVDAEKLSVRLLRVDRATSELERQVLAIEGSTAAVAGDGRMRQPGGGTVEVLNDTLRATHLRNLPASGRGDGRLLSPNLNYGVRSLVRQPTPSYIVNGSGFDVTLTGGFFDAPWGVSYALPTITFLNQPAATKLFYVRNIVSSESAGESGYLTADPSLINGINRVSVMTLTTPPVGQTTGGSTGSGTGGTTIPPTGGGSTGGNGGGAYSSI